MSVCLSVIAERSPIVLVLEIKLPKETRRSDRLGGGARSAPLGVLMSRKRRVRAAHGRAREAKTHLVDSATCSCSIELYKQWYTLADFFAKLEFSRGFLFV